MYKPKKKDINNSLSAVTFEVEKSFDEIKLYDQMISKLGSFYLTPKGSKFSTKTSQELFEDACCMFFTGGFWGANKEVSLVMNYLGEEYDLREIFSIVVINDSRLRKNDVTTLTCTRMALLLLPRAYEIRKSEQFKKAPIRKKVMAWDRPEDLQYVFVEGYKLFLKVDDDTLDKDDKLRIMAINAAAAHKTAKFSLDVLSGVADSFEKVCELSSLDPNEVAEVLEEHITLTGAGGALKALFLKHVDEDTGSRRRRRVYDSDESEEEDDILSKLLSLGIKERSKKKKRSVTKKGEVEKPEKKKEKGKKYV